jgi:hypothetical protein
MPEGGLVPSRLKRIFETNGVQSPDPIPLDGLAGDEPYNTLALSFPVRKTTLELRRRKNLQSLG